VVDVDPGPELAVERVYAAQGGFNDLGSGCAALDAVDDFDCRLLVRS
jgi:hypothetical protein